MANETYNDGFEAFERFLSSLNKAIESRELKVYIKKQAEDLREKVMQDKDIEHIENENNSANQEKVSKYKSSNGSYIEGNSITLYNDAFMTNDELTHFFNTTNRDKNYEGWSLVEQVEYGTGIVGASSSQNIGDEWGMGSKQGWVYKGDSDEDKVFTRGTQGKYIYYDLYLRSKDNVGDWVYNYLDKTFKEWK